uniref:D-2-hydroxyglutarate dehydrogenase, mitochondrial n=2 Tax=Macrostomum lignano TaxID=282301 RepID=A0A1I8H6V4_9PLAT
FQASRAASLLPQLLLRRRPAPAGAFALLARPASSASGGLPPLTTEIHPGIKRGAFSQLTDADLSAFEAIVGGDHVIKDADEVLSYNIDWLRICRGQGQLVLRPKTTEEVSAIVRHCNKRRLAVVPQGGNTGLVGGSVPLFDEIVISTSRMNSLLSIDPVSGVLVAEAGCVLEQLDREAASQGLMMPLDLGAKGSCQIGGNLATNAGGLRLLRYGSLRGTTLGLEAVLPTGQVLDCLTTLRKDNTGYDIKQLLIGSEGTLGIITKAAILCPARPKSVQLAFLGLDSFQAVLDTYRLARRSLGEILSAFEFIDSESMRAVKQNLGLSCPLGEHSFYVLAETSGSNETHDREKLDGFIESVMSMDGCATDGTVAQDAGQFAHLWSLRERIVESLLVDGYEYKYDVSLPLADIYRLVEHMRTRLDGRVIRTAGYGHLGDGNLHLNFTTPKFDAKVLELIEPHVFDWVRDRRGSVSAEHGLGLKKSQYIRHSKADFAVRVMAEVKRLLDPNGIMNPYKVLPDE